MDDKARRIVNECGRVAACQEWLDKLASDPRQFAFRSGPTSNASHAAETDLFFGPTGVLQGTITTFETDRAKYGGFAEGFVAAHEIGGHIVGTIDNQENGQRGTASTCGHNGCTQKAEAEYVKSGGRVNP